MQEGGQAACQPDAGASVPKRHEGSGVAILLTAAAVVAALIGGRASALAASAATSLQEGTRDKVKEAAAYVEQIRYVYGVEVPRALTLTEVRFRSEELERLSKGETFSPATISFLQYETAIQEEILAQALPASELASNPDYRTEEGFDPVLMLAAERANQPQFLDLDPEEQLDEGNHTSHQAIRMMASTIPVAFAFLFGSLARVFPGRRRVWLAAGVVFLVAGIVSASITEVL
ncbi:MAG: hypothetical protein M3174_03825 [Actinomycetota bacterium]|nr:hypothetical protein [Actinomycetota bacterium]